MINKNGDIIQVRTVHLVRDRNNKSTFLINTLYYKNISTSRSGLLFPFLIIKATHSKEHFKIVPSV